jgi:hypothetical protein
MYKLFFIFILLFILNFKSNHILAQPNLKIHVEIIKQGDFAKSRYDTGTFFLARMDITNNSDTSIAFWRMAILEWGLVSNDTNVKPYWPNIIDNVYRTLVHIDGRQTLTLEAIIQVTCPINDIKNNNYKLGLVFINEKEIKSYNSEGETIEAIMKLQDDKITKMKDIIWSQPFSFKNIIK